ncbi:MAG TPA: SDR family NAD(P)-dependent oxidoreductase [Reyranella sp.]|nr:SDR family NAD(P)-dependent oxidoreductase [Reyranella sp.]
MDLNGKTALVTGGTDGIGAEIARQLKAKGAQVIVAGRDAGRVKAAQDAGFEAIGADLTSAEGVDALVEALGGRAIDILVNNAGMGVEHDFREAAPDVAAADRTIFLNLNAPIRLTAALMTMLRSRPQAAIVNVTSGLAIAPRAASPVYCATKAGLRSYTQALRAQLADTNVRVIEALPPVVETRMTAARAGKKMSAGECARQIVEGIEGKKAEVNVGLTKVLQTVNSVSPALARRIMLRF